MRFSLEMRFLQMGCKTKPIKGNLNNGRPVRARTADLYRVNSEVQQLNPFACLAFPLSHSAKIA